MHGAAHGGILRQLRGIQLRIAPGQIQRADLPRQSGIPQRAEKAKLCAAFPQCLQRFCVGKAKSLILCNGNAHRRRHSDAGRGGRCRAVKQRIQSVPVDAPLGRIRQNLDLLLQISNLCCGFQAEMAALNGSLRQVGQITHYRQTGLLFQHWGQQLEQRFTAIVEQNARDMVRRAERQQPAQLGCQRQAGALRAHDQQRGQFERVRQLPYAGRIRHAAQPVIVAHSPLADGGIAVCRPLRI